MAPGAVDGPNAATIAVMALACSAGAVCTLLINGVTRSVRPPFQGRPRPSAMALDSIPAVAFVSREFASRWVSAIVFRLASDGVIAVFDDRTRVLQSWDRAVEHVQLEFTGDPADVSERAARGDVDCAVAGALFGDPPRRGGRVEALRTGVVASGLTVVSEALVERGQEQFGAVAPAAHRYARIAGVAGIGLGFIGAGFASDGSLVLGWIAIGLGASAVIGSVLVRRYRMLNADGIALRDGAERRRDILEDTAFESVTIGERVLPWAILFDLPSAIERLGEVAQRSGTSPHWYRSEEPFSAVRFSSCVEAVQLRMMPGAGFAVSGAGDFNALYAWQFGGGDGSWGFGESDFGDFGGGGGDFGGGEGGGGGDGGG